MTQESASWTIGNKKVKAIQINNKEVQSIEANNVVIWQKESEIDYDNYIELTVQGNTFASFSSRPSPFLYTGRVFIDWGDDTGLMEYTGNNFAHNYDSIDEYVVKVYGNITHILDSAFYQCDQLISVSIPDNVRYIGEQCFGMCSNLSNVILGNGITQIPQNCFWYCINLTSITIPSSITQIGESCFESCNSLTSISIPDSIADMGRFCFRSCKSLTDVYLNWISTDIISYNSDWIYYANTNLIFHIPGGTKSAYIDKGYPSNKTYEGYLELEFTGQTLSQYTPNTLIGSDIIIDYGDGNVVAYGGDYSHTYTTSGNYTIKIYGVTSLADSCFRNCTGLTSVNIPNSITSLGIGCFLSCTNLTSIKIPNSVTSLGDYCFRSCTSLAHIYLNWTSTDILTYNSNWISAAYGDLIFNVPTNTKSAYIDKEYPSDKLVTPLPPISTISLTTDKSILSYTDNESAILSATTLDENDIPIEGVTVEFWNGDTSMGTATTNSNGIATKSYSATGSGDIVFSATVDNLTSQSITVEDCKYYNTGDTISNLEIGSNVSCTTNGEYITITTSTNSEKYVFLPVTLANNWQYEVEVAESGANQDLTFIVNIGGCWGAIDHNSSNFTIVLDGGSYSNYPFTGNIVGGKLKITYINNTISVYFNNNLLVSKSRNVNNYKIGFYTNRNRVQKVKNIKLKAL